MPLPDEKTMTFDVYPYMAMVIGDASNIGSLIRTVRELPDVPANDWSVAHKFQNRLEYASDLQKRGAVQHRQGFQMRTESAFQAIERHAKSRGLQFLVLTRA